MRHLRATPFARIELAVKVHLEAFRRFPRAYLTAAKWWVLRKRVRARSQFAILLSETSRAYEWWSLKHRADFGAPSEPGTPPIVALIAGANDDNLLRTTLASLASEHIESHVIGPDALSDLARVAAAIDWSASPWLLLITAGDYLASGAVRAYRAEIASAASINAIFADDDLCDDSGCHKAPHFKPNWNAELHRHHDHLTGACIVRIDHAAFEASAVQCDWLGAIVSEALAAGGTAAHIAQVLHHRRKRRAPQLPLPAQPIARNLPRASIIVPTRNRVDLLSTCIAGIEATNYADLEVIIVDNDSEDPATVEFLAQLPNRGVRVLRHEGPFNYSAINNRAVAEATGELICLLNNDIEVLAPNWLEIMATQAMRANVGAVGAQLLYPDGRIQHAGVVIGVGNAAGHSHRFLRPDDEGYFRRHSLPQFTTAVTAACLVVQRDRFVAVGGLDETRFKVAFNDVDLCMRLNARGWQSLYEPRAVLVHHESVSRGLDHDPIGAARFAQELAALQKAWNTDRVIDPFHHPQLSRASEQFAIALSRN